MISLVSQSAADLLIYVKAQVSVIIPLPAHGQDRYVAAAAITDKGSDCFARFCAYSFASASHQLSQQIVGLLPPGQAQLSRRSPGLRPRFQSVLIASSGNG